MAVLKIVGYQTGKAKMDLAALLADRLGLDEAEGKRMSQAISENRTITFTFDDEATAVGLGQELDEAGIRVLIET